MRYRRRSDLLWRRSLDRVVVLADGADTTTVLTGTGVTLWALLEQPRSRGELVTELAGLYDATESEVDGDLGGVLDDLVCRAILEQVET